MKKLYIKKEVIEDGYQVSLEQSELNMETFGKDLLFQHVDPELLNLNENQRKELSKNGEITIQRELLIKTTIKIIE